MPLGAICRTSLSWLSPRPAVADGLTAPQISHSCPREPPGTVCHAHVHDSFVPLCGICQFLSHLFQPTSARSASALLSSWGPHWRLGSLCQGVCLVLLALSPLLATGWSCSWGGTLRRPGYCLCWRPPVSDTHLVQGRSGENTAYLFDGMSKKDLVTFSRACVHSSLLLYDLSWVQRQLGRNLLTQTRLWGSESRLPQVFLLGWACTACTVPSALIMTSPAGGSLVSCKWALDQAALPVSQTPRQLRRLAPGWN